MSTIFNYNEYEKILENMAQAKAILRNKNIPQENEDFQKILQTTNKDGYTGIITKFVFKENIDLQEALDLYNDLKTKKINVSDISNLSYDDVLDLVYKEEDENVKFCFKYNDYSVFYVKNYEGGLSICSPSWCLKTLSNWNNYMNTKKGIQFVVVHETAIKNNKVLLSTPNTYYGDTYTNTKKPYIRYGITVYPSGKYDYFDDNNNSAYGSNKPTILNELVPNIVDWINKNDISKNITVVPSDYDDFKELLLNSLSEIDDRTFDNGVYKYSKKEFGKFTSDIIHDMNITTEQFNEFFTNNKDRILEDTDFTSRSGTMDAILYSFYGDEIILSGIQLIERDMSDYSYKYYYGFHKYYWGRKLIEQSFVTVENWFKQLGKSFKKLIGVGDDLGIYHTKYDNDMELYKIEISEAEFNKYVQLNMFKNGSIVIFDVEKFVSDMAKSDENNDVDLSTFEDELLQNFDCTIMSDGKLKFSFLDIEYNEG